jgi:hypothetical protein
VGGQGTTAVPQERKPDPEDLDQRVTEAIRVGRTLDTTGWAGLIGWPRRAGEVRAPRLLEAWHAGVIDTTVVAAFAGPLWSETASPEKDLSHEDWRALFHAAGYTVDGRRACRPSRPVPLWRGALPKHKAGWSWTRRRGIAEWYASHEHLGTRTSEAEIYLTWAPADSILCRNTQRGEAEYVIDTDLVHITRVSRRRAARPRDQRLIEATHPALFGIGVAE